MPLDSMVIVPSLKLIRPQYVLPDRLLGLRPVPQCAGRSSAGLGQRLVVVVAKPRCSRRCCGTQSESMCACYAGSIGALAHASVWIGQGCYSVSLVMSRLRCDRTMRGRCGLRAPY